MLPLQTSHCTTNLSHLFQNSKKTFPSSADDQPAEPFPNASELKKTFPPTRDVDPGKPFPPSQENNNNFEDLHEENETFGEYDIKKAARDAINMFVL